MSHRLARRSALAAGAAALSLVVGLAPALAAEPDLSPITITGVTINQEVGGTPWNPMWGAVVSVDHTDSAPVVGESYKPYMQNSYTLNRGDDHNFAGGFLQMSFYDHPTFGPNAVTGAGNATTWTEPEPSAVYVSRGRYAVANPQAPERDQYEEWTESARSAVRTYRPRTILAPRRALISQNAKEKATTRTSIAAAPRGREIVAGKPTYITWSSAWDREARFHTRIGVARGTTMTAKNRSGSIVLERKGTATPVSSFTVPTKHIGSSVYVNVFGAKPDSQVWGFTWSNYAHGFPVVREQPTSWVRSYGAKVGTAKVGRKVSVKPATYSAAGRKAGLRARYQWTVGGKHVKGATKRTFSVPRSARGKVVAVVVTVNAKDVQTRTRSISFGTARR